MGKDKRTSPFGLFSLVIGLALAALILSFESSNVENKNLSRSNFQPIEFKFNHGYCIILTYNYSK